MASGVRTRLCLALDVASEAAARDLVRATKDVVDVYKVGLTLFARAGPAIVRELANDVDVFLDLKLHDIPVQVAGAVGAAAAAGARFVTVHASGGRDMMSAAADAAAGSVTILAVTVPTSLDDEALSAVGVDGGTAKQVVRLAELAVDVGAGGVVCSPVEVAALRARFRASSDGGPLLVVPGIRGPDDERDDQRRTLTAADAAAAGADLIVVGRPIADAPDPGAAAARIAEELG